MIIGGILLMLLAAVTGWFAWKVYDNKETRRSKELYSGFWVKYGHWFLGPLALMLLVIGIAMTFAILMVN
jgi:hypothetical protein